MLWISAYLVVGFVWSLWLYAGDRIEGEWHEVIFHTTLWPLDALEWVERRLLGHGKRPFQD